MVLGIAGAVLVGGIATGVVALDLHGSVTQRCESGVCPEDARADIETGAALTLAADVLYGTAALLAVTGVVWLIVEAASGDSDESAPTVSAACVPGLCGATLRAVF